MLQKLIALSPFVVSLVPDNMWAFLGVCAAFLGFWAVGQLARVSSAPESALAGWALVYLVCLVCAVAGLTDFRWIVTLLLACAVGSLCVHRRALLPSRGGLVSTLRLSPVVVSAWCTPLLHWDSYWHWALNASYLFRFNHFPAAPLDGFTSYQPTYPPATSLITYFSSLSTGRFREGAGMFMNIMLTLIALDCVVRLLQDVVTRQTDNSESGTLYRYGLPIAALGIVLTLNPSFRLINYFSAITDPALGVVVLLIIVRWCWFLGAGRADSGAHVSSFRSLLSNKDSARNLLVLFLLGVLIGGMKLGIWVLALVLAVSGICVGSALRIAWRRCLAPAIATLSGAVVAQSLWSLYLSAFLVKSGQFSMKPFSQWRFDLLPGLLKGIRADLLVEPFYYSLASLTVVAGVIALLRRSSLRNEPLLQMLAFVGVALPVYVLSILAAYLGTPIFTENEVLRAASLHRYSSHIGFAACAFGLVALISLLLRSSVISRLRLKGWHAAILGLGLYAIPLVWNILMPALSAGYSYLRVYQPLRSSAAMMANVIPPQNSVSIIGPDWAVNLGSYHLWRPADETRGPLLRGRDLVQTAADVRAGTEFIQREMTDQSIDYIWAFDASLLNAALGRPDARNYLWSRSTGQWRVIEEAPEFEIGGR